MYDPASRSIVLANRIPLTVSDMQATGQTIEYTEMVFKLCHDMADLNSDNAEYALFTAISIFSGMKRLRPKAQVRFSDQICPIVHLHCDVRRYHHYHRLVTFSSPPD